MVLSFVQLESHLTPCGLFECFCAINSVVNWTAECDEEAAQLGAAAGSKEKQEERREAEEKAQPGAGIW